MLYNPNPFGEISCFRYSTSKNSFMKYVLLIWALYASLNAYSQDCTQTLASQKPGIWKEGMKGSVSGIPTADLDKERKVVAAIHLLVKSKYSPILPADVLLLQLFSLYQGQLSGCPIRSLSFPLSKYLVFVMPKSGYSPGNMHSVKHKVPRLVIR